MSHVELAVTLPARVRGLLGRRRFDGILVLAPCNAIHTCGMGRAIDVAFVDRDGAVLESRTEMGPMGKMRCPRAFATLERFSDGSPWFEPGDSVAWRVAFAKGRQGEGESR